MSCICPWLPSLESMKNQSVRKDTMEYGSEIGFWGPAIQTEDWLSGPLQTRILKIWGSDWDNEEILKNNIQKKWRKDFRNRKV